MITGKKADTFEEYLAECFMENYHGDKDHYENAFDSWLENKDVGEVMELAQDWGDTLTR